MGGERWDRRCVTVSIGVESRYLMAESSGQRLELRKKKTTTTVEAHFDKTEYWMLNFLSCLPHTKKTIYKPLALLCALLCFIINGISRKRKQKRVLRSFAKTAELKHRRRNFTGLASIWSEYIHKLQQSFYFIIFFNFSHLPASICDNLAWGQG